MNSNLIENVLIFKALSDTNRMMIVEMLKDGEKCACKLLEAFEITQPTLSHHMRVLEECDLVTDRKDGKWVYYSLNTETIKRLQLYINSISLIQDKESDCE